MSDRGVLPDPDSSGDAGAVAPGEGGTPTSAEVLVDPNITYQTITGFGASDAFTPGISAAEASLLFDPTVGIGLSMLRIGIDASGSGLGAGTVGDAKLAASYGALVWGTPWSPPGFDKTNSTEDNGGSLCSAAGQGTCTASAYDDWANRLAAFPAWLQAQAGVAMYAISPQNEPDWTASYASCVYTAQQMVDFVKVLGPKLAALDPPVQLIAPEPANWTDLWTNTAGCDGTKGYGTCIHNDPVADSAVAIFAAHDYAFAPVAPPSWLGSRQVWETEVSGVQSSSQGGPSVDIGNGVAVAQWIHNALVTGGASAWHYWWLVSSAGNNDNEGLLFPVGYGPGGQGDVNSPPKRLFAVGQFSRFVRPGYVRVGVGGALPSGVLVSAYQNPADGTLVIVVINSSAVASAVTISVPAVGSPTTFTPWVTSATVNLASGAPVNVGGGQFSSTVAASSIVTFVGTP